MDNYQRHIHDYLDGTLPSHMQEELFSKMSCNEEMREEFSLQLSVQQKVNADVTTINAPDDVKENLFAQIGLPLHNPVVSFSETPLPLPTFSFSGFFSIGSIALIALLAGSFSTWFFMRENNSASIPDNMQNIISYSSDKNTKAQIPTITSTIDNKPAEGNVGRANTQPIVIPLLTLSDNQNDATVNNIDYQSTQTETIYSSPIQSYKVIHNFSEPHIQHNNIDFIQLPYFDENNIQLRLASISPIGADAHSAFIAQGMYELDEDNSIGIEYADGTYSRTRQEFIDGEELSQKENRKFMAISATYQHSFTSLQVFDIIPMLQVSLGGTTTGQPISRSSIGVRWTPESRISLTIGADISVLGYRNENHWNAAVNTGIISGVNIRF